MEIIKIKDSRYTDYENLLLRRDSLKKEGEQYYVKYLALFGELINDVFRLKIECIAKKKKIAYCQAKATRNEPIKADELERYISSVMASYQEQLEEMIAASKAAGDSTAITFAEERKIKETYRYLAKLIHPDRRPDLADEETIKELWKQIVIAYTHNQLDDLMELKFKTETWLNEHGKGNPDIEIPDIEEKIEKLLDEIEKILSSLPYQYRFVINDDNEIASKKQQLNDERKSYEEYSKQLDEVLNSFPVMRLVS